MLSILAQSFPVDMYEVIVIDNGSKDNTKEVVDDLNRIYDNRIRYFYDSRPGLHVGRHLGAGCAQGDILLYGDDDIIASPEWVEEIYGCYSDENVGAAGGKILPRFEAEPPEWLKVFTGDLGNLGYLSLLYLGDGILEINYYQIYGCNLSIRKELLFQLGGFHPDAMPQSLIKYRGDGEGALMRSLVDAGYKIIYNAKASVHHVIPVDRLTLEYFKRRSFNQGISDSFSLIREYGGINDEIFETRLRKPGVLRKISGIFICMKAINLRGLWYKLKYYDPIREAHREGLSYHKSEVERDPELLKWVLKENYFL